MLATMLMALAIVAQDPGAKAQEKPATPAAQADSPEQAIRSFIVALMTGDAAALRAVTLPNDDLDTIMPAQPVPPEERDDFKAHIAGLPVRVLKAGEEIKLPGGRTYQARPEEIGPDRAVVFPEGTGYPLASRKVEGKWRIDASPIVASMKAAARQAPPEPPKAIDPKLLKDKISIKPGQEIVVRFARDGDAISAPKVVGGEGAGAKAGAEDVRFDFTLKDEDRFLTTRNPFKTNLIFRAAARNKGRMDYYETSIIPVRAGLLGIETWRDPIEELVLFDFKLADDKP